MRSVLPVTGAILLSSIGIHSFYATPAAAMCAAPQHALCQELTVEVKKCEPNAKLQRPGQSALRAYTVTGKIVKSKGVPCPGDGSRIPFPGDHATGGSIQFGLESPQTEFCKNFQGTKSVRTKENCCDIIGVPCMTYWAMEILSD